MTLIFKSLNFIFTHELLVFQTSHSFQTKTEVVQIEFQNPAYHFASMGYKVSCINSTTNDSQRFMTEDIVVCSHHNQREVAIKMQNYSILFVFARKWCRTTGLQHNLSKKVHYYVNKPWQVDTIKHHELHFAASSYTQGCWDGCCS